MDWFLPDRDLSHERVNLVVLYSSGKVDNFIDKFIILRKGRANTSAPSFRNFAVIWSIPEALLVSRLWKIYLGTFSDMFDNSKSLDTLQEVLE